VSNNKTPVLLSIFPPLLKKSGPKYPSLPRGFITEAAYCSAASVNVMNDNIVYIGRKPVMNYCNAVLQVMAQNDSVRLMARGKAISHAVDVAEITRNRFLTDLEVESIDIGTEELESEMGNTRNVSNITITLSK
jgi:DNA-binding protein